MTTTSKLLSVPISEISETLGITRGTVYLAIKKGDIPHVHASGRIIVLRTLWNEYLLGKSLEKCPQCESELQRAS